MGCVRLGNTRSGLNAFLKIMEVERKQQNWWSHVGMGRKWVHRMAREGMTGCQGNE